MEQPQNRQQVITIQTCPKCGKSHDYTLQIHFRIKVLFFGGRSKSSKPLGTSQAKQAPNQWEVTLICPQTNEQFAYQVEVTPQRAEEIIEVIPMLNQDLPASPAEPPVQWLGVDMAQIEAQEWMKSSATNARDFCKTMLTTTTAAIPLFFAVVKYLGSDQLPTSVPKWVSAAPPVLFLLSAAIFVLALHPQAGMAATVQEFLRFRNERIHWMNKFIWVGTGLFGLGIVVSLFIFGSMLPA